MYEGRGFNVQGAHTSGYNSRGYGTSFMGNFMTDIPTPTSVNTYLEFQNVKLSWNHKKLVY